MRKRPSMSFTGAFVMRYHGEQPMRIDSDNPGDCIRTCDCVQVLKSGRNKVLLARLGGSFSIHPQPVLPLNPLHPVRWDSRLSGQFQHCPSTAELPSAWSARSCPDQYRDSREREHCGRPRSAATPTSGCSALSSSDKRCVDSAIVCRFRRTASWSV